MFLQESIVKVFVKIKVLKSPGMICQCTYGVTIPKDTYKLRGGGRGGVSASGATRGAVLG